MKWEKSLARSIPTNSRSNSTMSGSVLKPGFPNVFVFGQVNVQAVLGNFEKEILKAQKRNESLSRVEGKGIEVVGAGDQADGYLFFIGEGNDPRKQRTCDSLAEKVRMDVHDPKRDMSRAGMIKAGPGNLSAFRADRQKAASRVEGLVDLAEKAGVGSRPGKDRVFPTQAYQEFVDS